MELVKLDKLAFQIFPFISVYDFAVLNQTESNCACDTS